MAGAPGFVGFVQGRQIFEAGRWYKCAPISYGGKLCSDCICQQEGRSAREQLGSGEGIEGFYVIMKPARPKTDPIFLSRGYLNAEWFARRTMCNPDLIGRYGGTKLG